MHSVKLRCKLRKVASMHMEEMEKMKKIAGALLIILGITGLFLGFFYIRQNISLSTTIQKSTADENQKFTESIATLQFQDTDKDGISDYEELYMYNTSPYLEDTDSDGINDKEEIAAGEDPTCPKGEDCFGGSSLASPYSELEPMTTTIPDEPPEGISTTPLQDLTAEELRKMLKDSGLSDDILNQVSDDDLEEMLAETLGEIESSQ